MSSVFKFEPLKLNVIVELLDYFFKKTIVLLQDHLQTRLVSILLGNPANDRRSSCATSKETTAPISGSHSKTLFCFVCDGNSVPKGHLLWSTDVRKFPSLFPFPDLTNFLESLSSLCCFLPLLELLYLFRCMCK